MTSSVQLPGPVRGEEHAAAAETVIHLVREHARLRPDAVAVESGETLLTYAALWRRVLVIAAALDEAGAGPGDRVVVRADRSAGVVAAALAVMALRAVYVPVDPAHPVERTAAVVSGADPVAVVHDGTGFPEAPAGRVLPVLDVAALPDPPGGTAPPERELPRAGDAAYVVFTSGSTGKPKGVVVEHGSLVNYVGWCGSLVGRSGDGSPLFASLGFDLAMTSLWVPLAQGRRVVTVAGMWDQAALFRARDPRYTFLKLTPSHARFFDVLAEPPRYARATRTLMFGGEGLDPALVRTLAPRLGGVRLINHYGPTETTIGCCAHVFDRGTEIGTPTVPIGTPAWNTRAHVVDEQLRPVPPGTAGELVIAGRAVAAGYLGRPADERFVDESELGGPSGRAYRTGDMVERLDSGALLYLGRRDDQLKVSGHRVELGELRHHVLSVPGVADTAFEVVRGPVDTLAAFVVPTQPRTGADAKDFGELVRSVLAGVLPSVLVPGEVHVVSRLVVNANGKCDVRATRERLRELAG
ncbi:amino acid adenylation domain-containing protein [Streptomyces lycii]|uniref:Amino acid adenylation domain-containing protein n=1 Tax=Streptomyces lycii TaxID=2654337 RepID=A0ABQ7FDR8_9ACTN|nr:amino acid adenylation domain-containing protein [Streptomyces lycii]KAF4406795.1 amino acid adenylation domain-containing protein [Streptomyces lycii]